MPVPVAAARSKAARLLRLWVRIPPGAWMSLCVECCMLSGRGLCDEPITRPEESYRLYCVVVCDLKPRERGGPGSLGAVAPKTNKQKDSSSKIRGVAGSMRSSPESEHCVCNFVTGPGPPHVILSRLHNFRGTSLRPQQVQYLPINLPLWTGIGTKLNHQFKTNGGMLTLHIRFVCRMNTQ